MDLTKSESSILEILLNAEVPLSKSAIIEHSPRNKCQKYKHLQTYTYY